MATTVTETELETLNSEQNNTATTSDTEQTYEGKFVGTLVGNATTAKELEAPYRLTLTGDVSGTTQLNASDTNMSVTVNHASSADTADFAGKTNLAARSTLADMANTAEFSYRAGKLSKLFVNITGACVGSGSATDSDTIDINIDNINVAELFIVGALPEEKANTSRIYVDISNRHFWIYNNDTAKWYDCFEQLETELDNHELRIADLEKLDLSNRVTSLETRATANDVTVADFEKRITANSTTLADYKTKIATAESNIDNLETRATTNETNIKTNTDNISALDTRVTTTEANVTKLDQRVENIETSSEVGQLANKITDIENKNAEQDTSIQANADAISILNISVNTAEENITKITQRVDNIETSSDAGQLASKITDIENKNAEQDTSIKTNADAITALNTSVATQLEAQNSTVETKLSEFTTTINEKISAQDADIKKQISDQSSAVETKISDFTTDITAKIDAQNTSVTNKIDEFTTSITNQLNTQNTDVSDKLATVVSLTGDQTITGNKLFENTSSSVTTASADVVIDNTSPDNIILPKLTTTDSSDSSETTTPTSYSITINNGTTNTAWTKCIKLEDRTSTISFGNAWNWIGGNVPELVDNCLLVAKWCSDFGLANIISAEN